MACTGQSASQYVEGARRHLVNGLQSLSIILENLFQQEVLCEEEVSKIQAEKDDFDKRRQILDKVIKKGDGACYEFLRIIDKTRQRTLGKPSLENVGFDLHYWISCYPFREDTKMDNKYLQGPRQCLNFQNRLKSKAQIAHQEFWSLKKNLCRPNLSYSPLVLETHGSIGPSKTKKFKSKKSKLSRPKKLRTYLPEEKVQISPSDLMKKNNTILLVGKSGIGKTAVAHEMWRQWAERHDTELDYMLYFDMRGASHFTTAMKLQDLLFNEFSQSDEDRDEVLRDIMKNSEKVTMIFDGVSDLHSSSVVQRLVKKDLLPDAKIIITCRPDDEEDIEDDLPENFLRVEVKGFSEQTIRTYLSENLGEEHKQVVNNLELFTLCHVPMYALMVVVCFSSKTQPCTITELYINIVRFCLQKNSKTRERFLNSYIKTEGEKILALAKAAFDATERKSVILTGLGCEDTCVCPFLKTLNIKVAPTDTETTSAFLHYTMQEFFAALWLLKNPRQMKDVLQQCFTEEKKHMKHLIPFMCRLFNEKAPRLMEFLIPADELKKTSKHFFEELDTTLIPRQSNQQSETEDSSDYVDVLFLCQCLYESQSPETCLLFLDKLDYCLDLSGQSLDPFSCCAVSYVVTQSQEKKVKLNLEDVTVSEEGLRQLHGCLKNVHWCSLLPRQLWKSLLFGVEEMDHISLGGLNGNQLHLPVNSKSVSDCFTPVKVSWRDANDCFYWNKTTPAYQNLYEVFSKILSNIRSLSFETQISDVPEETKLLGNLFCAAAEGEELTGEKILQLLSSVCMYQTFPLTQRWMDFQLDLYSYEPEVAVKVLPALQSVPTVWTIDLSKRKASILLEVLKLQSEKKQVKVKGCSHEESEVRSFLQCLPYISQLSFYPWFGLKDQVKFCGNLFCAAAERDQQTGEKILQLLSSVCKYQTFPLNDEGDEYLDEDEYQSVFLLDLYCHVKDYDSTTGMSVLPALQSVLQSVPTVWTIDLSKRKASILLEVLKLQSEKKQVEVKGCSHEESEVRSFLQCLPYISQLRCLASHASQEAKFYGNLFCAAAERDQQTGEKILQLLSSVCMYQTFPLTQKWVDFQLDLYSYEPEVAVKVLPALQSVLPSVPTVWTIDLSKRKASILLEVLKLQSEKKQVEVTGCSHEESEVRSFLQCLPYISQLRCLALNASQEAKFCGNLFCAAAERDQQTGEKILQLLSSVCMYQTFPLTQKWVDFQLDLYSYEPEVAVKVLPVLQSVLQSVPTVWTIDLSKRKASILLEVLKLQSEKKQVEVKGCSHEESEVRSFLQCLPYISQLRCLALNASQEAKFCGNLFCAAAERDQQTGEKILQLLSLVCKYQTFPLTQKWVDFQLDLYSYEPEVAVKVLPALQSVLQSVPTVWTIDLSKRKASILLEVLKLQSEKKQVEVKGCSHEESEVRSFLQCLPYISQLSFYPWSDFKDQVKFCGNLFCAAAERDQQTGEKILQLLSSVCKYQTFPLNDRHTDYEYQCGFLLDLCCHVKDYDSTTGMSVLPALQSVLQSVPTVWTIDLSERKASILLEVLKLQSRKKQVEVKGCSHEESEVRSFLQCLPYISQLSFHYCSAFKDQVKFCGNLFCAAAERDQQTGEKILQLLSSVCKYQTFPLTQKWVDFQLDLYSYEPEVAVKVLPALQSVLQSVPTVWTIDLSKRKASILLEVLKLQSEKKQVEVKGCSHEESEVRSFLQCLPYISQLSFHPCSAFKDQVKFCGNLFCAAAERDQQTGEKILQLLSSVCKYQTFPLTQKWMDFQLDLYSYEPEVAVKVLPALQSVLQSVPTVWTIDLSERKASILLEVLKLQSEKKQVKVKGCSHEESEVRSFLQCLPYISQLSFHPCSDFKDEVKFCGNLFCAAAERDQQTGEKILQLLSSVCKYQTFPLNVRHTDYEYQCDFLLDLCCHVKDYDSTTGMSVLPALQSVLQSVPTVWTIDLSERKASILLEVLKLQSEKKQVEVTGCSHEESEVRSFLQCLPYISQLSFHPWSAFKDEVKFCGNLFCAAAERDQQTGEKILRLLSSVCKYQTFPLNVRHTDYEYQCDFLLDLCCHVKDYDSTTGMSVLPALQSVLQSVHTVWTIDLSERKASILLEVLKLQSEKKQVKVTGCSHEESEVRSFLQCLPYISQLSFYPWSDFKDEVKFCGNLFCAAAERDQQTGEKILQLLSSVCKYQTFPLNDKNYEDQDEDEYQSVFLLDLYCHVKDYDSTTGMSVLPALQSVLQSVHTVWTIDLSERKASILLEVLKLQSGKKQVEVTGCSHEESEVRSFLQCLPYISQLSFHPCSDFKDEVKFCGNLFCAAAERDQQTGEKILQLLSSVCKYQTFPLNVRHTDYKYQSDFLLDLYCHVKDYDSTTGMSVLPALQSVLQSVPTVWTIDLSKRKASILLEVLKLQSEKKQVEVTGCSHEESEVRSFLQCLPYISQLSFHPWSDFKDQVKFCGNLFCAAAERDQQTGEKILQLLSSVCKYQTFPLNVRHTDYKYQSVFLLDLCCHVKDYDSTTGMSVLPALQSVLQSVPTVWTIDLSKRKASILLEVLKLQSEKKQVEVKGCSHEESEVRSFLQCLPYISQLSCYPAFFQNVCSSISIRSREETQQLVSLLQLQGFSLLLEGELNQKTCRSVGRLLRLCGQKVDLILTPTQISPRRASVLFKQTSHLHSLRLSDSVASLLFRWMRRRRVVCAFAVEELCLFSKTNKRSDPALLKVVSVVSRLLRFWMVRCLDLTEFCVPALSLITLLLHDAPLKIKLNTDKYRQLVVLLHEIQDKDLSCSFVSKCGGDLSTCCLNWELLHYLLQQPHHTFTVNMRNNSFLEENITRLLPFVDRIRFLRPSPSFVLAAIREIGKAQARHIIPGFLRSLDHMLSLTCRELDSADFTALLFTLKHCDRVKVNLLWTSIPTEETQSLLFTLDRVSQLSVDRDLLLRLVHCCAASNVHQRAASDLLRSLQHRLDLSRSSCVVLSDRDQSEALILTAEDCRAVSVILRHISQDTQLDLRDCEVEDSGLDLLLPVPDRVHLRASKAVVLRLLSLVPVNNERDTVRRTQSLWKALRGELDLSHTTLDQRTCGALALMLDLSEGLTELDLSHCQLSDQLLFTLSSHLHKVQVLDLSHNQITDASTFVFLRLLWMNTPTQTVRLFGNNIVDRTPFNKDKRFEIW
ncbi:uncharacterized protein LOC115437549 [Sphaeramia orbicularis]|uniref:uncharacterized protein LOC115437549 n=1 Tax=Sphaeramia orbicularis TaxID=375764 RepID=UPI00117C7026|nr:uncharacterized protein LOC115437549 [Sphaeramia orbicularis]